MKNMSKFQGNKKKIIQKGKSLLDLLENDSDNLFACNDALNQISELFGNVDLSIFQRKALDVVTVATTLNNDDSISQLRNSIKHYLNTDLGKIPTTFKIRQRPDVVSTRTLRLKTGKRIEAYLVIDVYDASFYYDEKKYNEILILLALITRISLLEKDSELAYKADPLTLLPTRESAVEQLNKYIETAEKDKNLYFAMLGIVNGSELNREKGYDKVNAYLQSIAVILKRKGKNTFRIGGMKFAIISDEELHQTCSIMQDAITDIKNVCPDIITNIICIPVMDEAYKTIYICEKNIKHIEPDVVTIYRDDPNLDIKEPRSEDFIIEVEAKDIRYVEDAVSIDEENSDFIDGVEQTGEPIRAEMVVEHQDLFDEFESAFNSNSNENPSNDDEESMIIDFDEDDGL